MLQWSTTVEIAANVPVSSTIAIASNMMRKLTPQWAWCDGTDRTFLLVHSLDGTHLCSHQQQQIVRDGFLGTRVITSKP